MKLAANLATFLSLQTSELLGSLNTVQEYTEVPTRIYSQAERKRKKSIAQVGVKQGSVLIA